MIKMITIFDYPPYSPDLPPLDYLLLARIKVHLKGQKLDNIADVQTNVTPELNTIPQKQFLKAMLDLKRAPVLRLVKRRLF